VTSGELALSCSNEQEAPSHAISFAFKTILITWLDYTGSAFVKHVKTPYPVTLTSLHKLAEVLIFFRPRPVVLMPKPVPFTVNKVPPSLPPVDGVISRNF
jgi:hypothetical protein